MAAAEGLAQLWTLAGTVLAPAVLGAGLLRLLGLGAAPGLRVFAAWSYLLGQFTLAPVVLCWLVLHQPVPGWVLTTSAALAGAAILWQKGFGPARPARQPLEWWVVAATLILIALVVDRCLLHNLEPVTAGDEADIWAAKAKVLYASPGFDLRFGLSFYVSHPDYPLFNPLVQVLSFAHAGSILQYQNRLPVQGFAVALLLLLSAALQRRCSVPVTIMALCAFTASSFLAIGTSCYADVMLAFALLAAAFAWLQWQQTSDRAWWRLCCVALAALLSTKNEGALLALAAAGAVLLARLWRGREAGGPRPGRDWWWLGAPLLAVLVQVWFNAHFGLTNDLLDPSLGQGQGLFGRMLARFPERALPVARFYGGLLFEEQGRLLVVLFLAAVAASWRRLRQRPELPLALLVVLALLGYMLVFVGTNADLQWHLLTAADRTVLHVLPVATLGLGMALGWSSVVPRRGGAPAP